MEKKNFLIAILVLVLLFGIFVTGCNSIKTNYYNLGDASEDNCALVQVTPVFNTDNEYIKTENGRMPKSESEYPIVNFVEIDGQGDKKQWRAPPEGVFKHKAIVRVTPGVHTFTLFFIRDGRENPASVTYNCKAGKGYEFRLIATTYYAMLHTGINFPTKTEIIIDEFDLNEKGSFKLLPSNTVRKEEIHDGFNDGVIDTIRVIH